MRFKLAKVSVRALHDHFADYTRRIYKGRRYKIISRGTPILALVPISDLRALHALVRMSDEAFLELMAAMMRVSEHKEDRVAISYLTSWKDQFNCDETKPLPEVADEVVDEE